MSNLRALEQARDAFMRGGTADRQTRYDDAAALGEWRIFSNAQISHFTRVDPHAVAKLTGKKDRTGGRLPGEALPYLIRYMRAKNRSELDWTELRGALNVGASTRMVARMTGVPQSTVRYHTALRQAATP
jgi:hypothetical protein